MVDIKGFEGLYGVTSCGKIWGYKENRFLNTWDNGKGYYYTDLYKDGVKYRRYIHRLVAEAYIPNPDNLPEVDHIDSCKTHNYVNNLQWISHIDNSTKATGRKIRCIELDRIFNSQKEAALALHLDQGNISRVCNGKARTTGGYHFEFVIEEEISMEKIEAITNKFPEDLKNDTMLTAAEICYDEGIITYDEFNYVMKYLDEVNK